MIRLERFEKRYGKVQAVKPLDLQVCRGESFALLGPNGCGKTSIIRSVVGLHRPTGGRILVDGIDVVQSPCELEKRLSYVPQRVSIPEVLTAREVATAFARLKGVPGARVDEVLDLFALTDDADRQTREFSGGMVQRLGLAIAFLKEVPLFVLDEPTVNLDPKGVDQLRQLLGELRDRGTTILFSSHLLQTALRLADRVAVLVDGELVRIEAAPSFREAVTHETVIRVVVNAVTDSIVDAARRAGADVSRRNAKQVLFKAMPARRLRIIRAIEDAGASIEEVHTEAPDWESLVRKHFDSGERPT